MAGEFASTYAVGDYSTLGAGLTGAVDGKSFLVSLWVRGTATGTRYIISSSDLGSVVYTTVASLVRCWMENAAGTRIAFYSVDVPLSDAAVHHVIISATTGGAGPLAYVDDGAVTPTVTNDIDADIDFTKADWSIGAALDGSTSFVGDLSEVYFTNEFLDISVEANRRKFISASGKPVPLGSDGSFPTGSQPLIYCPDGNGADNKGSGGNFTNQATLTRIVGPGAKPSATAKIYSVLN